MDIFINGKKFSFGEAQNLWQILEEFPLRQDLGFAVALNTRVIPKSELRETSVKEGDEIEIIQATTGG